MFLLEFEDCEGLREELEPYLAAYEAEVPMYELKDRNLTVKEPVRITDCQGICFEREILDYMKVGIWKQEDALGVGQLTEEIREAGTVWEIAEEYQDQGRKVLSLERALERIGACGRKQLEYQEQGKKKLKQCDGNGFLRTAEKLDQELGKIPGLVDAYEKEADRLKRELADSEQRMEQKREGMQSETWQKVAEEMDIYQSYVEEEGSRRQEVKETVKQAEKNRETVARAVEKAKEVQEYIDDWEPDDEDDELDEEALWERVQEIWREFEPDRRFEVSRVKETEKMNLLERISRMAKGDLLSVCVPEGMEVSRAVLDTRDLPSRLSGMGQKEALHPVEEVVGTILFHEYASRYFAHARREDSDTDGMKSSADGFLYEQEYILNGAASDRENLHAVVKQLVGVREAFNLMFLLGDAEKRGEARTMALAITGAAGLTPLVWVTTFFILTVWAFAEALEDVRILLADGRIPILKAEDEWRISLTGLAEKGVSGRIGSLSGKGEESASKSSSDDERGYDYQGWLKLLYLAMGRITMRYRMMDMMQNRLRERQPDFRMENCAYSIEAELSGQGSLVPMRWYRLKEY